LPEICRRISWNELRLNLLFFDQGPEGDDAFEKAMNNPDLYVVKPQREGGGNNVYGQEIRFLVFNFSCKIGIQIMLISIRT
jgi:hypothetical protein